MSTTWFQEVCLPWTQGMLEHNEETGGSQIMNGIDAG